MTNLKTAHVNVERPGPGIPIFSTIMIPLAMVIWLSIGTHSSVIEPPGRSIFLVAFLTQIGLAIIYTGEWVVYRMNTPKRPFSIIGLEVSPVAASIVFAVSAPAAIFALGAML